MSAIEWMAKKMMPKEYEGAIGALLSKAEGGGLDGLTSNLAELQQLLEHYRPAVDGFATEAECHSFLEQHARFMFVLEQVLQGVGAVQALFGGAPPPEDAAAAAAPSDPDADPTEEAREGLRAYADDVAFLISRAYPVRVVVTSDAGHVHASEQPATALPGTPPAEGGNPSSSSCLDATPAGGPALSSSAAPRAVRVPDPQCVMRPEQIAARGCLRRFESCEGCELLWLETQEGRS